MVSCNSDLPSGYHCICLTTVEPLAKDHCKSGCRCYVFDKSETIGKSSENALKRGIKKKKNCASEGLIDMWRWNWHLICCVRVCMHPSKLDFSRREVQCVHTPSLCSRGSYHFLVALKSRKDGCCRQALLLICDAQAKKKKGGRVSSMIWVNFTCWQRGLLFVR